MKIGIAGFFETSHNYRRALAFSHARLPFSATDPLLTEVSLDPNAAKGWDGLILPGGGDIDPVLLPDRGSIAPALLSDGDSIDPSLLPNQGGTDPSLLPNRSSIDPALDKKQLALLALFAQYRRPVLGICKGMQLINVFFGGGLWEHLAQAETHRYKECDQFHPSHAEKDSFLARLYGEDFPVNSAHHQGVSFPGKNIRIIQRAPDGVIEGIEHAFLPIVGLQWHPERLLPRSDNTGSVGSFLIKKDIPSAADGSLIFAQFLTAVRTDMHRR